MKFASRHFPVVIKTQDADVVYERMNELPGQQDAFGAPVTRQEKVPGGLKENK